jgi:hypothetical protein
MKDEQLEQIISAINDLKSVLVDIGKLQENAVQMLKIIASNSQEQNDWNTWRR